ncbi:MAG: TonB-dependent receptor [Chitinophagaceae bacterium]|nr:TonB-dependent receptor [Chitinophagaceae bacterium]
MKKIFTAILVMLSVAGLAQKATIEGNIYDENQVALQGITIQIESSRHITATDIDGHFFIASIQAGSYTLLATGVGYAAKSKTIIITGGEKVTLNLQLNTVLNTLEEVTVTAKKRLAITNTASLTRTNTAAKDLPQSIQSVSRSTLNEQQIYTVSDAMKDVAGVNVSSNYGSYNFRGFNTTAAGFLTNGIKGSMFPEGVSNSLANIESIEVLRGPAAILYGENAMGGNINFVTKQPKKSLTTNSAVSAGSFGLFRMQADVTGSINKNKSLYYVAGFGTENGGKVTKDWKNQNALIFTAVKWEANDKTSLQLNANYNYDNSTSNYEITLPFIKEDVFSSPTDFNFHGNDAKFKGNSFQLQGQLHHKINNNWGLHLLTGLSQSNADAIYYSIGDYTDPTNDNKVERIKTYSKTRITTPTLNAYTTGIFNIGIIKNSFTAGVDLHKENWIYPAGYRIYSADSISVTHPDHSPFIPEPGPLAADYLYSSYEIFQLKTMGAYIQDQFSIGEKWKGIIGLRYNHYGNFYRADSVNYEDFGTYEERPLKTTAFIPRFGIVFQPTKQVSLYADYNSGFQPQFSNNKLSGGPFKPETANQFEAGAKGEFLQGQLVPTVAFYHINKNNVLTPDLNDPTGNLMRPVGQVRSKGFEATLTGTVIKNWNVIANYAFNETRITKSNEPDEIGMIFSNAPKHITSIWTTYSFIKNGQGLKIGAGYRYTSSRFIRDVKTSDINRVVLPSYSVVDAMIQYDIKRISLYVNANNMLNKKYVQGSYSSRSVFIGTPRDFVATIAYRFVK